MRGRALVFVLVVAVGLAVPDRVQSEQYRWVDEQGNVHYSDRAPRTPAQSEQTAGPAPSRPAEPAPPATPAASRPPEAPRAATPPPPTPPPAPVVTAPRSPAPPIEPPRPSAAPAAPAAASAPTAAIREVMELAGIDRWIDYLATAARDEFARYRWRIDNPDAAWAVLSQTFRRDALSAAAATALSQRLAPDDVAPLLEMLRSPLSRKMTTLLAEAVMPARAREYRAFVAKLPVLPPPPARVAMLQRLERDERQVEFELEMTRILKASAARLLSVLTGSGRRTAENDDDEDDDEHPFGSDEAFRFYVITMMLFAYQNVPDDEVIEHLRLSESPLAQRAGHAFRESLREVVRVAEQRAATALETLAPANRPAKRKARR